MQSKVAPFAAAPDSTYGRQTSHHGHELVVPGSPSGPEGEADLRLVIEEDGATGAIIYRTVDRNTGRVVAEYSRDAVLKMSEDAGYVAGEMIRAKA